jgi:diguanylate cyclase (GGDEF)-like protein
LVNDNFGHPYGDKFLKYFADLLNNCLSRANDTTFRIGGDEFAAILVNTPVNEVLGICNKIKKELNKKILVPESYVMNQADVLNLVTLSIGVVYIPFNSGSTLANVVIAADQALYQSKQQGKNQIILKKLD